MHIDKEKMQKEFKKLQKKLKSDQDETKNLKRLLEDHTSKSDLILK